MNTRQRLMMQSGGGGVLPKGYTRIYGAYAPNANVSINTGFIPSQNATIKAIVIPLKEAGTYPFSSNNCLQLTVRIYNASASTVRLFGANFNYLESNTREGEVLQLEIINGRDLKITREDGSSVSKDSGVPTMNVANTMLHSSINGGYKSKSVIIGYYLFDGFDVFNLIPCIRDDDGMVGYYNLVKDQRYGVFFGDPNLMEYKR